MNLLPIHCLKVCFIWFKEAKVEISRQLPNLEIPKPAESTLLPP